MVPQLVGKHGKGRPINGVFRQVFLRKPISFYLAKKVYVINNVGVSVFIQGKTVANICARCQHKIIGYISRIANLVQTILGLFVVLHAILVANFFRNLLAIKVNILCACFCG